MNIIEINNLCHCFPDGTRSLDHINLSVAAGSFVVVAGENGSGKTTLFKHLNGLLQPESGEVIIDGLRVAENVRRTRQTVGMVFQDADNQIVGETVKDDVAFGPENLCLPREEIESRVQAALNAVGLIHLRNQRPHLLSGGEKRRLAVAGIIAMASKIFVFDEPFSNLDYPGIKQVLAQMVALHRAGHTLLVATHDIEKVIAHADRMIVLKAGRIVRDGPPEETLPGIDRYGVREPRAARAGLEMESWLN
jgi:biotin transport system ATP-binding protein